MKIKSIKPTNKFAEIKFKEIIDDPVGKRVLTPSGFQPVLACEHIKRGSTIKIGTKFGELLCDPMHRLMLSDGSSKFAVNLQETDKLMGYGNEAVSFTFRPGLIEDLYDIQLPDPHWWYTSGVVSHNSIVLCNNAISSLQGVGKDKKPGQDVLLITFELDTIKTAMRCLGAATSVPLNEMGSHRDYVTRLMKQMQKTYNRRFAIFEWPPDECSVAHIYALLDNLKRTEGWRPDVIVLDYMDLMVSRVPSYNKDDYTRQKHVANEIRGLAKNEYVLVYTATQTNRDGANAEVVDLTKAAESFAKQFSLDYVVSLNQSESDRQAKTPQIRFRIAKNRNGPKNETVTCSVNYNTMLVKELL